MASPASPADVRDRDRANLSDGVTDAALNVDLNDAWTLLLVEAPDAAAVDPERTQYVLARMVLRHLATPEGRTVRQVSETRGPMTASRTYDGPSDGRGGLYVTDEDLRILRGLPAERPQRVFTIDTTPRR